MTFGKEMKKIIIAVLAIGVALGLAFLLSPRIIWDGSVSREIKVTVRDTSGRVVENAEVSLIQNQEEHLRGFLGEADFAKHLYESQHRTKTDRYGKGILVGRFGAGGGSGMFGRTGFFLVGGDLEVTHSEYTDFTSPLMNFTEDRRISIRESRIELTVHVKKKPNKMLR